MTHQAPIFGIHVSYTPYRIQPLETSRSYHETRKSMHIRIRRSSFAS
jgi:hypothetical protein